MGTTRKRAASNDDAQASNKVQNKRIRASDFIVGKKKRKKPRTRSVRADKDGESVVSKLLSEVANLADEECENDSELESDVEALRDAVLEAREADENEESDQNSLADTDDDEDADEEVENNTSSVHENGSNGANESDVASNDSDVEMDMKTLKDSDPNFYKYLQENDAALLEFGESDEEDGEEIEEENRPEDSDGHDEESDSEDERLAAAEAGLSPAPVRKKEKQNNVKVVDIKYLRNLQLELSKRRTSLKACQDLLRIFRSGRELVVSNEVMNRSKKKAAKAKKKSDRKASQSERNDLNEEDDDINEEFEDEKSYDAGKVRFVSAKAYQKAMNMAIIGIQETLDNLLGKPRNNTSKKTPQDWSPENHKRWNNLKPIFNGFVFHVIALTEHMTDARTLRFLLKRLEFLVPYTKENPGLTRRLGTLSLSVWSSSDRKVSRATKLRAFFLLHALASETENSEIVLRKVYACYSKNIASVCNTRTLPSILFSVNCMVELFGIDMGASYSVAFTALRGIAVTLRTVLTSKDSKTDIDKIYNWTIINSIRLWSCVLARYGTEDELASLIYPFVQVSLGILRLPCTPKSYPLQLHVCSFVTDLTSETGVFVPVPPHLLAILRCSELKQKPKRGAIRPLEWRALLRVEDEVVGTKPYLGGVIRGVVFQLAKYFASISKHVSFPELAHATTVELQKVAKEIRVPEWKRDILDLRDQLRKTGAMVVEARAKSGLGPQDALGQDGMRLCVAGLPEGMKTPIQRLYELEKSRNAREERMRDDSKQGAKNDGNADKDSDADDEPQPVKKVLKSKRKPKSIAITVPGDSDEPDQVAGLNLSDSDE